MLLALTAVAAATGALAFASHLPVDQAAGSVMLLIGLAVGVDYSLFYLKREREERALGKGREAALEARAATSGRSVLISGLTVIVAMAGMFLAGNQTFVGIGLGTIIVVATAILGSLTVLPAILSRLGTESKPDGFQDWVAREAAGSRAFGPLFSIVCCGGRCSRPSSRGAC